MAIPGTYIIICEGASECNYLEHLNRFLSTLPLPKGDVPIQLRFIPRPRVIDSAAGVNIGCGGGDFGKIQKAFRREWPKNRAYPFGIWVDSDLYVRNDRHNREQYLGRPKNMPEFSFSILNFEDFAALHGDDASFEKWKTVFSEAGHFRCPMHWDDYKPLYLKVFPTYRKNLLPVDFLSVETLNNLFRHMDEMPEIDFHGLTVNNTFAGLLREVLCANYPQYFGSYCGPVMESLESK